MDRPKVGVGPGAGKANSRPVSFLSVIVMFSLLLIVGSEALTQYLAHLLGYPAELGRPMFRTVYAPWQWIGWSQTFYGDYKPTFTKAYELVGSGSAIVFALYALLAGNLRRMKPSGMDDMFGTAHWADRSEIMQAGLLPTKEKTQGVYVGGWVDKRGQTHYLRHNGPEHVMAFAPTRSGKGISLVIPTLLSWPESVVVLDIKGENYALTAGWRKKHANNVVLRFDPASPDGLVARFNPLDAIRMDRKHLTADVQNLVTMIVDPDGKGLNDHWAKTGHALLVGAVLHCLYKAQNGEGRATLAGALDLLSDPRTPIMSVLEGMRTYKHTKDGPDPVVAACATDMLNKAENERSGVLSTSISFLTLYRDRTVKDNTSESDFTIKDLMHHKKPVSLYLVVSPGDKDRLKPLLRLMVNQIMRILVGDPMAYKDGAAIPQYKHRLLLLVDEFPSLGRLDIFQEALAFIAGYGIKAYLIVQDMSQLYNSYGKDESITSNCHIRVAFAPNKPETAEYVSKLLGTQTIVKDSITNSGERMAPVMSQVSHHFAEHQRPLLTPDECMKLPGPKKDSAGKIVAPGDMLVFAAGTAPIYGRQTPYFLDPIFDARSKVVPPMETDRLRHVRGKEKTGGKKDSAKNQQVESTKEDHVNGRERNEEKYAGNSPAAGQGQESGGSGAAGNGQVRNSGGSGATGNGQGQGNRSSDPEDSGGVANGDSGTGGADRNEAGGNGAGLGGSQKNCGDIPNGAAEDTKRGQKNCDDSGAGGGSMDKALPPSKPASTGNRSDMPGRRDDNDGDHSIKIEVAAWNDLFAAAARKAATQGVKQESRGVSVDGNLSEQPPTEQENSKAGKRIYGRTVEIFLKATSRGSETFSIATGHLKEKLKKWSRKKQEVEERFKMEVGWIGRRLAPKWLVKKFDAKKGIPAVQPEVPDATSNETAGHLKKIEERFKREIGRTGCELKALKEFIDKFEEAMPEEPRFLGFLGRAEFKGLLECWTKDRDYLHDKCEKLEEKLSDLEEFAEKLEMAGQPTDAERADALASASKEDGVSTIEKYWKDQFQKHISIIHARAMRMGAQARIDLSFEKERQKKHDEKKPRGAKGIDEQQRQRKYDAKRSRKAKKVDAWERENERLARRCGTLYKRVVIASRYQYGGAAEEKAEKILGGLDPELVQSLAEARKKEAERRKAKEEEKKKNAKAAAK